MTSKSTARLVTLCSGLLASGLSALPSAAWAQNDLQTEDGFREVFVTAGYSAAFGAAIGAALLPFFPNPSLSSLRYVAGGASLGFIAGSGFAIYNLSNTTANAYPAEEPQDDFGAQEDVDEVSAMPRVRPLQPLPVGSLLVGRDDRLGLSIPTFSLVNRGALVNVLRYEH